LQRTLHDAWLLHEKTVAALKGQSEHALYASVARNDKPFPVTGV
jgi:hypothetical protein